ncbi:2-phospho-L-lactate guanylyltransferase [Hydrogenophaga sp.]|uniref:2-phospho-L-lactate guanylyltransferase n=1 Tax=Hydrogenophaga sp. TaxID=1904254 RepID=UPI002726FEDF|nr:2-phospho-L-lactate guanylyltransferase [Hydrogenophaga sp.]MDO9433945.1 2-phospho-L-lactate guanylyltransferase [Hydrogenophaga sp.]
MTHPHVLIPVKSLTEGKSRLAAVLSRGERRHLVESLVRRTLALGCAFADPWRCAVVSPCAETLEVANAYGVQTIEQRGAPGLNAGLTDALTRLREEGAGDVLIVASDMPLLRLEDLAAVSRLGQSRQALVVGSDRHGMGTNLLFIPAHVSINLRFGEGSLGAHLLEAARAGCECTVHRSETTGFDLDTPADLTWLREAGHGAATPPAQGKPLLRQLRKMRRPAPTFAPKLST